jgi:hypothetical protein
MEWVIIGGIVVVVLLRATANAGAAGGNALLQTITAEAMAYVPFAHAGNAYTLGANPRALNGNGQPVSDPTAAVINSGAADAVIQQNYVNSNTASLASQEVFSWQDPSTGAVTMVNVYWKAARSNDNALVQLGVGGWVWRAPLVYSGPVPMVNCPQPDLGAGPGATLPNQQISGGLSW